MKRLLLPSTLLAIVLTPTLLYAQENGDSGITMGYPASIGFIWHASDKVAIRPELALSRTTSDTTTSVDSAESTTNSISVGASVLFYLRKWDRVQTYVAPRYTFGRTSSKSESSALGSESTSITNTHTVAGYFGAQYSPHQHFSIFGEVGVGVQRATGGVVDDLTENHATTVSTRTGVGVILYF